MVSRVLGTILAIVSAFAPPFAHADIETDFGRLDADKDGRITLQEAGRRRGLIRAADNDGDSALTLDELKTWLQKRKADIKPDPDAKPQITVGMIPPESPISEASCRAAAEYSTKQNGYSFLVMLDGKIVFERYDQGWNADKAHRLASGTKSFSGAILAAAVQDGLLTLDEPASKTLAEWKSDAQLSKITLRQLLSLTSGIDPGDNGSVPSYREAVAAKALHPAGEKFAYGPAPFQIFGEVIRRKLDARGDLDFADPLTYLSDRVLDPIGLKVSTWRRDADGMPLLPSGALVTAREWAKYGEFLRQEGKWDGKTLVDPETLVACHTGSMANPVYGLTFWLLGAGRGQADGAPGLEGGGNRREKDQGAGELSSLLTGAYMAAGAGKQRLYIIPSSKLVVVRQGESKGQRFENEELLGRLLGLVGR